MIAANRTTVPAASQESDFGLRAEKHIENGFRVV
jgi:hypothetical protein